MIEPIEQQMLTELAASPAVAQAGLIVEFGTFFGRSTACLVNGAATWWTPDRGAPAVRAHDLFRCNVHEGFAPHVIGFARQWGVEGLLRRDGDDIDFQPVFRRFVGSAEDKGLLTSTAVELSQIRHDGAPIGLMHLDAPKLYDDFKYVLFRFFPSLVPGGYVVFQDYFYHWSASLIAAAELLAGTGMLQFERSAASSAVARVLRAPTTAELIELDLTMQTMPTTQLLDGALQRAKTMQIDRPEQFVARVHLAKMQHLWKAGRYAEADQVLGDMFAANGGRMPTAVFADLRELLRSGFGAG